MLAVCMNCLLTTWEFIKFCLFLREIILKFISSCLSLTSSYLPWFWHNKAKLFSCLATSGWSSPKTCQRVKHRQNISTCHVVSVFNWLTLWIHNHNFNIGGIYPWYLCREQWVDRCWEYVWDNGYMSCCPRTHPPYNYNI